MTLEICNFEELVERISDAIAAKLKIDQDNRTKLENRIREYNELIRKIQTDPNTLIFTDQFFVIGDDHFVVEVRRGRASLKRQLLNTRTFEVAMEINEEDLYKR